MHRFFLIIIIALLSYGQAQVSDTHTTRIRIPNYIGIKIVDATGNITNNASVIFDYSTDPATYRNATLGSQVLPPTQVVNFSDVQVVWRSTGNWRVYVRATPLVFTGIGPGSGFNLNDVRVRRGVVSGKTLGPTIANANVLTTWSLTTNWQRVVNESGGTQGWESLGFNGRDYEILVQGNEKDGQYATVVTYLLTYP
jgi:hypothetical protein